MIAIFIVSHLLHLTSNRIHPVPALGLHVRHGLWSALVDLGANTSVARRRRLNAADTTIATVITVGFLMPPFATPLRLGRLRADMSFQDDAKGGSR